MAASGQKSVVLAKNERGRTFVEYEGPIAAYQGDTIEDSLA